METKGKYGYVCFYNNQHTEIYADSLSDAKEKAVAYFKAPKSKRHMVSVILAEKDGEPVTHDPAIL